MSPSQLPAPWRLVVAATLGVFVTMFLPWYSRNAVGSNLQAREDSLNAWQSFSFVEAAVLLVVVGVLALLYARVQRKPFHLPGGDGAVVMAAGLWVCFLVFYRQLDKPSDQRENGVIASFGVTWGIFLTFLAGAALAYAGFNLRKAHLAEPALPGDPDPTDVPARRRERAERRRDLDRERFEAPRRDERPRPEPGEAPTAVARRPRPKDRTSGWLGREGAVRDLGGLGATPRRDADPAEQPTTRQPRRRPAAADDEQPPLPFDEPS